MFGDIIGIKNAVNELVASYTYNAWGECTIGTNIDGIATLNPFRYRGYYYDTETGFYYLQTRYYDPTICRFISADDPEILGELASVVGQLNLYAYCLNNPVMFTDETGSFVLAVLIGLTVAGFLVGTYTGIRDGLTGWNLIGRMFLGAAIGLAVGGAIVAASGAFATVVGMFKGATVMLGGMASTQVFAIGALAYNFTAMVVAPLASIDMEPIETVENPYQAPNYKNQQYRHPSLRP